MEEKKNIKISLGGAIAIAIGVIALLIAILYAIITGISVKQELADKEAKLNTMEDKINKINMAINEVQKEVDKNKNALEVNVNSLTNTNTIQNSTNTVQNEVTNTATNTTVSANNITPNTVVDTKKMEEAYKKIISEKSLNNYVAYATADINKDGVKELVLSIGEAEVVKTYEFYTYKDGKELYLGEVAGGNKVYYEMNGKDYLVAVFGHMGEERIYKVSIINDKITSNLESSRTVPINEDYKTGDKAIEFKNVK